MRGRQEIECRLIVALCTRGCSPAGRRTRHGRSRGRSGCSCRDPKPHRRPRCAGQRFEGNHFRLHSVVKQRALRRSKLLRIGGRRRHRGQSTLRFRRRSQTSAAPPTAVIQGRIGASTISTLHHLYTSSLTSRNNRKCDCATVSDWYHFREQFSFFYLTHHFSFVTQIVHLWLFSSSRLRSRSRFPRRGPRKRRRCLRIPA